MKPSVYLETTIISYLAARPSGDLIIAAHQKITRDWWFTAFDHFRLFVSEAVKQEAEGGDADAAARRVRVMKGIPLLPVTPQNIRLAERLAKETRLPQNAAVDALHIAVAADHAIEYLLTWNCKHIASPVFRPRIELFCRDHGLVPPNIITPIEIMGLQ